MDSPLPIKNLDSFSVVYITISTFTPESITLNRGRYSMGAAAEIWQRVHCTLPETTESRRLLLSYLNIGV